ncbi:protein eyes shut homolog [Sardina pilchardus]|uniref:protein eyes shut homolog n=1 Tax=Sardina pilchardus TaxID=27697 RepID=UPI002E0F764A
MSPNKAPEWTSMKRLNLHLIAFLLGYFMDDGLSGQAICKRAAPREWRARPQSSTVKWTLMENTCTGLTQCHGEQIEGDEEGARSQTPNASLSGLSQLCPLELQLGDALYAVADPTLEEYGLNLVNVSKESFDDCSVAQPRPSQRLFSGDMNGTTKVEPKWLTSGVHYFVASHDGSSRLCKLGLRLRVWVKEQNCQPSPLVRLCSGNGLCRTDAWSPAYTCECQEHYLGRFCGRYDVCSANPCLNGATCVSRGSSDPNVHTYECNCSPGFTGINCSDIIGNENCNKQCLNGQCVQVTTASFRCDCLSGYTGSLCDMRKTPCLSNPCKNGGKCVETAEGYACSCPEGFAVPQCRRVRQPCASSPCLNNGSCVSLGGDYTCRCGRGFTGKNCEEIIDYCRLHSINCLNEGLCLNLIGGYNCLCAPGWTGEFCQHVENACLIYPEGCRNGATCISISQPTAPPRYTCKCPPGYAGRHCEAEVDECDSNPCRQNGTCSDLVGSYQCTCPPGFFGTNCEMDVDACALPNATCPSKTVCLDLPDGFRYTCRTPCPQHIQPCANGGRCILNNATSYSCVCPPGWTGHNCLIDINDCNQHWCQNGATCVDKVNGYSCRCPPGFTGPYCEVDVDYCVGHQCSEHGTCLDQEQNYTCRCQPGYEGARCEMRVNQCRSSPCINGASCIETAHGYQCLCAPGFEGKTCSENVNDCWSRPCLNGGSCKDLTNGYVCFCTFGFQGKDCSVDVDLCSLDLCQEHTLKCIETKDGNNVTCVCEKGFGGPFCEVNQNDCGSMPCQNGAVCVDGVDTYLCFCPEGKSAAQFHTPPCQTVPTRFKGDSCEINYNECDYGFCTNNSTCVDLPGDYTCICPQGFTGKNCSVPIPNCERVCPNNATCSATQGLGGQGCSGPAGECVSNPCRAAGTSVCVEQVSGFKCVCRHGYTGRLCETPISHCVYGLCQHGSKCVDLRGGFTCQCLPGLTGRFCEVNVDDCADDPCGVLSFCKDALNGYNCFCAPGFIGNNCEIEVNECLSQPCLNGGTCSDELNGFSCRCPHGVTGDLCEISVDVCQPSPCQHNGTCIDLAFGYKCLCLPGFTGSECELDIDECASSPCKNGATCIDQPGNYSCQCVAPFKGLNCEFLPCEASNPCENGAECVAAPQDRERFPLGFQCLCQPGFAGPRCESNVDECASGPCIHGFCYDVVDGFYCLCNPGYAGVRCEQDIDDCVSNMCVNNSTCVDLHMGYQCHCPPGWEGEFCQEEVNECASQPCKNNGTCTDLLNGYRCTCARGWTGSDCSDDINECDSAPCLNGARCVQSELPGEFSCTCPPFFSGPLCRTPFDPCDPQHDPCRHNATCRPRPDGAASCDCLAGFEGTHCEIDTNECGSSPCQNQGYCVDGINGYTCDCKPGFSGRLCEEDINECASSPCQNGGICQELVNSFRCNCPPGYFGALCSLDVNECEASPCLHDGVCINRPGGFTCICLPGFSGTWCELNVNECDSDPCQNNGRCVDGPSGYQCFCPKGFSGSDCETNIDECASSPCLHGSCVDGTGAFHCQCELGWTGYTCETNIDECTSRPCLNGGSCVDLTDKYACFCLDGYAGKNCEVDISICLQNMSLCFNGGTCLDGPGANFTCSCPPGFVGDFCEVDFNECCSEPCQNGAVCQDLTNRYYCHCRPGWTGPHCEDDINECLPQPCNQGMCIQNDPGHGYTCFCRPGFVGSHCEHNYDDCLLRPCPSGFACVDGINRASCVPAELGVSSVPALAATAMPPSWGLGDGDGTGTGTTTATATLYPLLPPPATGLPVPVLQNTEPADISYVRYAGDSYLEFQGVDLGTMSTITLRFQTLAANGTLLYSDQGRDASAFFFIKLFVQQGTLQYDFSCNREEGVRRINTSIHVADGAEYLVHVRQYLAPCEAEVAVSGYDRVRSIPSNYWSGLTIQRTSRLLLGGLPLSYSPYKGAQPFYNYSGCLEVIEMNKLRGFYVSSAISGSNVKNCRPGWSNGPHDAPTASPMEITTTALSSAPNRTATSPPPPPPPPPVYPAVACYEGLCRNGGTCQQLQQPTGAWAFRCDCPLHFSGRFCEKDTTVYFPFFNGTSYLELQSLTSLLQSDVPGAISSAPSRESPVTLYLTVKTRASDAIILYAREQNFGDRFLHVFLQDGRPGARLGCGGVRPLSAFAARNISNDKLTAITVRYRLPVTGGVGLCMIEVAVDNGTSSQQREYIAHPVSEVALGPTFLGGVPSLSELHVEAGRPPGLVGCVRELQVNARELDVAGEALRGRNILNCHASVCQHQPCRNGGTCVSDVEDWACLCPPLFSGKLCQFTACTQSPCTHGGTCVPQSRTEAVCVCPYGRRGLLCEDAINITRPRFSGLDEFGYTSFMAYSPIPSGNFFYEFQLKLTLANNISAMKNNLILYSGQKGQGINGDDFVVLGVRSGRVVHKFNLGSGVGTVVSDRLNPRITIHTVRFGRYLRTGWLKVDGQKNKTTSSPGQLAGLNTFSQFYVGGYNEYTPELLPVGARFQNGFQGCIFDLQFRTRGDGRFRAPGQPEGHPISGRSVGQCGVNPCSLVRCQNGGVCVDAGSTVYCQCVFGWKGALCSEKVSVCDAEHSPPPMCAKGSTCVPLPKGYTCLCPLGTGGQHCQQALAISDPYFSGNLSSWMSFAPVSVRHKTHLQMQFQTLSPEGIMFYMAQHLTARAGDFISVSLTDGFVQLRYNLGDGTIVLQSKNKVDPTGRVWHNLQTGRQGDHSYLILDGEVVTQNATEVMTTLDVATDIFIGGVSSLSAVATNAVENEPTTFTGCIREVVVNGVDLDLTEKGATNGANVGDWDGTACGYKVCQNSGLCRAVGLASFTCSCPPIWTGPRCDESVYCVGNLCRHGSLCVANVTASTHSCMCSLGWNGPYCDEPVSMNAVKFVGDSYLKYKDPQYYQRNLRYTQISLNFTTSREDGLIVWMGRAQTEDDDFLAVGLRDGHLQIAINLGERIPVPLVYPNVTLCCDKWNFITVVHNRTVIQVFLDEERVIFEDVDPFERYVAINYDGVYYFGGFELNRNVSAITSGLFSTGFEGSIKDVILFQDTRKLQFLQSYEGFNVYKGDE